MTKLYLSVLIAALAIGGWSLRKSQMAETITSDLLLNNVEAIAGGESGGSSRCVGSGNITCPATGEKVDWVSTRSIPK